MAAAKDVSMAGLVGSLAMLLECNRLGVSLDLDALPVPAGVTLERWINCFPCLSFLMCVPPGREEDCLHAFGLRWWSGGRGRRHPRRHRPATAQLWPGRRRPCSTWVWSR